MSHVPPSKSVELTSALSTFGFSLILIAIISGGIQFWEISGRTLIPSGTYLSIIGLLCCAAALFLRKLTLPHFSPLGAAAALLLLFVTDWLCRGYSLFQGPSIRGELLVASCAVFFFAGKRFGLFLQVACAGSLLLLMTALFQTADGRPIISDDHASFIFRLIALKENFPNIPFYSPLWNGGFDARDFFATGALNIFFIGWPLIYAGDVFSIYNILVATVLFIILPASLFAACRVTDIKYPGPAIAVLLGIACSLLWYRWALKYGTIGFITTAALIPINFAVCTKLLAESKVTRLQILFLIVSLSLMFFWSLSILVFFPLGVLALSRIRSLLTSRRTKILIIAILVLNIPWMVIFCSVSNVFQFVHKGSAAPSTIGPAGGFNHAAPIESTAPQPSFKTKKGELSLKATLRTIRETAISTHPLLILFLIPGLFLLPQNRRRYFFVVCAWLLFLGAFIAPLKPQLELDRMLLILALLGCIPSAAALSEFLRFHESKVFSLQRALQSLTAAFLLVGPWCATAIVKNRSVEQYFFASKLTKNLTAAIREYGGEGRTLFSGFSLHEMDGGHVAPLPYRTGKPLMASSPFHNLWKYRQIFPQSFMERKNNGGIEEYLNLYNVTAVTAHEREWREYFSAKPELYTQLWKEGRFTLFTRNNIHPSFVLKGQAEVIATDHSIQIIAYSDEVVLKFNYFPFLSASACELSVEKIAPEVNFIKLSKCPIGQTVTIKAGSVWERVLHSLT